MQAAQNGREQETLASLSLESMAGLTQLGLIMLCLHSMCSMQVNSGFLSLCLPQPPSLML